MTTVFDAILALSALFVAYFALARGDLFRSVVLFITFGVLLSLIWVRLGAFDLALVEVAIGAGLTGALFLNALGWKNRNMSADDAEPAEEQGGS